MGDDVLLSRACGRDFTEEYNAEERFCKCLNFRNDHYNSAFVKIFIGSTMHESS